MSHFTRDDVGRRITVRRTIGGDPGRVSDVVGELVAWTEQHLVVRRVDGSTTSVPRNAVVAGRVVTPVPAATPSVEELEEIAARGWPSPDTMWLGRWWLRAAAGFTGRANSVLPLGSPGLPLDPALSAVLRWYDERGLPARFLLETGASLDRELVGRGWVEPSHRGGSVLVQTASLASAIVSVSALTDSTLPAVITTPSHRRDGWPCIATGKPSTQSPERSSPSILGSGSRSFAIRLTG